MGLNTNVRQTLSALHSEIPVEAAPDRELDLRRLMLMAWRAKWLMALFTVLGLTFAYAQLLRITPLYTAEAKVLWDVNQTNVAGLDPVAGSLISDYFALASQIEVITSGHLLERVVTDLNLVDDPVMNGNLVQPEGWTRWLSLTGLLSQAKNYVFGADTELAVKETPDELKNRITIALRDAIEAEWLDSTYVLIIRMTTSDPKRSAELANEMARFYILNQLESKYEATRQATVWLSARVADLRVELESAERSVEEFSSNTSLVSEEALGASARQLKDLRERALALSEGQKEIAARLESVQASLTTGDFATVATLMREPSLARLAVEIASQSEPGQSTPRENLIERFEVELDRAKTRLSIAMERLKGQEVTIRETIGGLDEKLASQGTALVQLRQLRRESDASRLIYEFFLARLKESSVQEGIQRPDARVLTKAEIPIAPSSPRRGVKLMAGGGIGLFLALALIFMIERLNTSFRSAEELESRTGQTAIGTIPMAPTSQRRQFLHYLIDRPTSSVAEAFRNLRTSILLANVDIPPQVIMLTSAMPNEGKTTCCISLAQISKQMGKRVLLIECDLRRRTFRSYFDLPERGGLLSVLGGAKNFDDVVYHDEATGLDILPGEESSVNAADIFASHRFSDFLAEMRGQFDFIFIDTPPVLVVPDARVIAKSSDAVIFCVRWNKTARDTVIEGLRFFAQINIKIAGVVLSQVNIKKMSSYGYSDYGHFKESIKYYRN